MKMIQLKMSLRTIRSHAISKIRSVGEADGCNNPLRGTSATVNSSPAEFVNGQMNRSQRCARAAFSSLLKKGADPLRPFVFPMFQHGLQRVRPLFQQAVSKESPFLFRVLESIDWQSVPNGTQIDANAPPKMNTTVDEPATYWACAPHDGWNGS